jgi:hypothetical protein
LQCPLLSKSGQTRLRLDCQLSAISGHSWPLAARTQQPKESYRVGFLWDGIFSAEQGIQAREQEISPAKTEIIVG